MKKIVFLLISLISLSAYSSDDVHKPKIIEWPFDGYTGTFDRSAIQRGYKVYKEVCSLCHGMHLVSFRNLQEIGFTSDQVKALAAEIQVTDGPNDQGDMYQRPGAPSDRFPSPFANEQAARASNNGAYPPDLSLIVKAREDGANYLHSLLTGFGQTPPPGMEIPDGMHYNPYFPGGKIAMAPPLSENQVTFDDGTDASVEQMSQDVVNFLQWAAEPEMEARKRMGIKVMGYLAVFTVVFYFAMKRVWGRLKDC